MKIKWLCGVWSYTANSWVPTSATRDWRLSVVQLFSQRVVYDLMHYTHLVVLFAMILIIFDLQISFVYHMIQKNILHGQKAYHMVMWYALTYHMLYHVVCYYLWHNGYNVIVSFIRMDDSFVIIS